MGDCIGDEDGDAGEEIHGEVDEGGGHEVAGFDGAEGEGVGVGAGIVGDADGAVGGEDGEVLVGLGGKAG